MIGVRVATRSEDGQAYVITDAKPPRIDLFTRDACEFRTLYRAEMYATLGVRTDKLTDALRFGVA